MQDVSKTSWRRFEDILARRLEDLWPRPLYWSWSRRLVDFFWRRMCKVNIFVFIKTSWRRLLKTKTKDVFIKTNVCWVITHETFASSLIKVTLFRVFVCVIACVFCIFFAFAVFSSMSLFQNLHAKVNYKNTYSVCWTMFQVDVKSPQWPQLNFFRCLYEEN